jgi:putative heme-binding domain-containing protein
MRKWWGERAFVGALALLFAAHGPSVGLADEPGRRPILAINKGDKIVLLGNTLAEREQYFGQFETLLHSRFPTDELVVRNLGWSADELTLRPRQANFDDHGHTLKDHKPDVILAFFGFNESFAGPAGLKKFEEDLEKFITQTTTTRYNGKAPPRLALISPIAHEDVGRPGVTDGKENNKNLKLYKEAIGRLAAAHQGVVFADLFTPTLRLMAQAPKKLTFNGIHLTDYGYQQVAPLLDTALFGPRPAKADKIDLAKLRAEILEKNRQFFYDYRAVNGAYIYGGRKKPFGVVNFPDEFAKLRKMIDNRDHRVWAVAQGKSVPNHIDDSNTGELKPILTNFKGQVVLTPPEEAARKFFLPPGFEINLFASEVQFPELEKPCQMAFDTKGRLWVTTMPSYPMYLPGQPVNDKVLILEDTKGTGQADKCSVFADKLYLPTGIALGDGGAYVAQQPNLVFLKDTDGDGKADYKEMILHGFDTADSHHAINAFRWGPGGDLYFMEGTFLHSQVETPYGPQRVKNAGVYRYEPKTEKLDIWCSYGFANPWGICFDHWGQPFVADASGGANYWGTAFSGRVNYPNKHPRLKQFLVKQWRPICGCEVVESRNFPEEMQGDYLLNNCIGFQGVLQYRFKDDGAGFAADAVEPLLRSSDPNFRPVDIAFGPDGALYICDWFNPLIGHMQHSVRDPNRDKNHGRIWRITNKNRPLVKRPQIAGQPILALLDLLKQPESYTRHQARMELRSRDSREVVSAVEKWLAKLDKEDKEYPHQMLEALWVSQHHNVVNEPLLKELLRAPDYRVRAAATYVLCYWRDRVSRPLELLRVQVNDAHPRVRLEAVRALSFFEGPEAQAVAMEALAHSQDYYLEYTFKETMAVLGPAANLHDVAKLPRERQGGLVKLICQQGGTKELDRLFEQCLTADTFSADVRLQALDGLAEAALLRKVQPTKKGLTRVRNLLKEKDPALQAAALRLAGVWKVEAARKDLENVALKQGSPDALVEAALDGLARLGGKGSMTVLEKLLTPDRPLHRRYLAAAALARLDAVAAAPRAAEVLSKGTEEDDPSSLLTAFLDLKGGPEKLAAALEKQPPPADIAKLALRYLNAAGRSDPELVTTLSKAAGLNVNPKPPTTEEVKEILDEVAKRGDAARGEKVFRRLDLGCMNCHALNGAGGTVGPDLRDVGSISPPDYLLRSILVPEESVKEAYEAIRVQTSDGKVFQGIVVEDTPVRLVLKEATGQLKTIAKDDVEERSKGGTLMPKGLANFMTRGELVDVVRFLEELGKPGPYALQLKPTLRRWRVLRTVPESLASGTPDAKLFQERVLGAPEALWAAAYAQVSGELPLEELLPAKGPRVLYLQAEIDVKMPGKVGLQMDGPPEMQLWIDDQPRSVDRQVVADLPAGRHKVTLRLDPSRQRVSSLRVDLVPIEGSKAVAAVVGGP